MINVIYTYKQYKKEPVHLSDRGIDMMRISVESANKFHPTTLYCCKDSYSFFVENKIPFGNIIILDELSDIPKSENPVWSYPKIISMKYQTSRWLHLDFDCILTKPFEEYEDDFVFGFHDTSLDNQYIHPATVYHVWDIYFWWFFRLHDTEQNKFQWDFKNIPNAGFMYCNNPADVIKSINKFEKDNKWITEKTDWSNDELDKIGDLCCYFEQFLFTKYLKDNDINVRILQREGYHNTNDNSDLTLLNSNPMEIKRWVDNGWFHFPLYKSIDDNILNSIYTYFWKKFNINENRKFKITL
jgi:hypothetical protein